MKYNYFSNDINLSISILNTKLRDNYSSLLELCDDEMIDYNELINYLNNNNYEYCKDINQVKIK